MEVAKRFSQFSRCQLLGEIHKLEILNVFYKTEAEKSNTFLHKYINKTLETESKYCRELFDKDDEIDEIKLSLDKKDEELEKIKREHKYYRICEKYQYEY